MKEDKQNIYVTIDGKAIPLQEFSIGTLNIFNKENYENMKNDFINNGNILCESPIDIFEKELIKFTSKTQLILVRELFRLSVLFPNSFVNRQNELILIPKTNLYFLLNNLETYFDLKCKIISACSRDCCKRMPYRQNWRNEKYQKEVRDKINKFLRVGFNEDEWMLICTYLGNGCNGDLCKQFVKRDFDINVIKEYENRSKIWK